jgi:hypothetical protein
MKRDAEYILNDKKYLKNTFESLKESYKWHICDMYDFNFDDSYWTGNVLSAADYFLGFYDVMYAVDNNVNEKILFDWYDYNLTLGEYEFGNVSLENFCKGIIPYDKVCISKLEELTSIYNRTKAEIDDLVNRIKK